MSLISLISRRQQEEREKLLAYSMGGGGKGTLTARLAGSGTAGILELIIFHPVDTVAKRLMSNETKVIVPGKILENLNSAIFKKHANSSAFVKYTSLFPGISFGAAYKVLQRVYKFGGQPFVRDFLTKNFKGSFDSVFGERHAKTIIYATAGSIMGVGEIVLLPLDVLKIKAQTNPDAFKGRGLFKIISDEGMALYRGSAWTAARNAPGSFALFGGSAFTKEYIFDLKSYSDATFFQDSMASIIGAVCSITVAAPLDVIKTRIQKRDFQDKTSGAQILKDLIQKEGFSAFFKGLIPKIGVIGPKLVFSFTVAQQLMSIFEKSF